MGRSDILSARLRDLEQERRILARTVTVSPSASELVLGIADRWRDVVEGLEQLPKRATAEEMEEARETLHALVGEVVVEEDGGVFAYPKLNAEAVYNLGAEERTLSPRTL